MIDIISNWASELVVSLVVVTLIEMLLPDNKIKKYVKTIIGIYIIFCIISPFVDKEKFATIVKNTEKNLEKIQIENQAASSNNTSESIEELYIEEFEKKVTKKVEELGYIVNKCEIDIEIDATKDDAGINAIYLEIGDKKINNLESENAQIESVQKVEISINNELPGNNKNNEETKDTKELKDFLSNYYEIDIEKIKITQN